MTLLSRSVALLNPTEEKDPDATSSNLYQAVNAVHASLKTDETLTLILQSLSKAPAALFTKLTQFIEKAAESETTLANLTEDFRRDFLPRARSPIDIQQVAEKIAQDIPNKQQEFKPMFIELFKLYFQAAFAFPSIRAERPQTARQLAALEHIQQQLAVANQIIAYCRTAQHSIESLTNRFITGTQQNHRDIQQFLTIKKQKIVDSFTHSDNTFTARFLSLAELHTEVKISQNTVLLSAYEEERQSLLADLTKGNVVSEEKDVELDDPLPYFDTAIKDLQQNIANHFAGLKALCTSFPETKLGEDTPIPLMQMDFHFLPNIPDTFKKGKSHFVDNNCNDFLEKTSKVITCSRFSADKTPLAECVQRSIISMATTLQDSELATQKYDSTIGEVIKTARAKVSAIVADSIAAHKQFAEQMRVLQQEHLQRLQSLRTEVQQLTFSFQDHHPYLWAGLKVGAVTSSAAAIASALTLTQVTTLVQALVISAGSATLGVRCLSRLFPPRRHLPTTETAPNDLTVPLLSAASQTTRGAVRVSIPPRNSTPFYANSPVLLLFKAQQRDLSNKMSVLTSVKKLAKGRMLQAQSNPTLVTFNKAMEKIENIKSAADENTLKLIHENLSTARIALVSVIGGKHYSSPEEYNLLHAINQQLQAIKEIMHTSNEELHIDSDDEEELSSYAMTIY